MKYIILTIALFLSITKNAYSQKVQEKVADQILKLYPEGQHKDKGIYENGLKITAGPGEANGLTGKTESFSDEMHTKNVCDDAAIELFFPEKCEGQMIVVCPGGGYWFNAMNNEGRRVADWLCQKGIAACVVMYRMPNGHPRIPLTDVQNAFRYCRSHAKEWGVKQIGVMGFSAGGHLAAMASNFYQDKVTRPDFSILIYPWISLYDEQDATPVCRQNLVGKTNAEDSQIKFMYSMDKQVTENTPPTYLAMSIDDKTLNLRHVFEYAESMKNHNVKGEVHIFPQGSHGWGFTFGKYGKDGLGMARNDFFISLERFLNEVKQLTVE